MQLWINRIRLGNYAVRAEIKRLPRVGEQIVVGTRGS